MAVIPLTHRSEMVAAHRRLLATLDGAAGQDWATAPSSLPEWTRGHVVAHLLGNAEGLHRLTQWAATGQETPMYASPESRAAEIEARATLPLSQLQAALTLETEQLVAELDALAHPLGARTLVLGSGAEFETWELAMIRTREVEIHHVDLADGYTAQDWSPTFTLRTMGQVTSTFAARGNLPVSAVIAGDTGRVWTFDTQGPELVGDEAQALAWFIGRPHTGLTCRAGEAVPTAPRWV